MASVTVAIPTRNAGRTFDEVLAAVRAQNLDRPVQLLICDTDSSDDTVAIGRSYGAEVIGIRREAFSHGGTRNLLVSRAEGDHVAFLTQDAIPATDSWLASLVGAFDLRPDVALTYGPYLPREDASLQVKRELETWFGSVSPDRARVDALEPSQRGIPAQAFLGPLGYFTDANGCLARRAWEEVPFRSVAYAEDHLLAQDMLRAGWAKVYVPNAAVIHSHDYTPMQWLRRSFDEARGVREVYGWALDGRSAARNVWGNVGADLRWAGSERPVTGRLALLAQSTIHHSARAAGSLLGGRSDRLPRGVSRRLSLERRY